jgi:hypothetical protein
VFFAIAKIMFAITINASRRRLSYKIITRDGKRLMYLHDDPPQYLSPADLWRWLVDTRDDDPALYAELVPVYCQLTAAIPRRKLEQMYR